MKIVCLGGSNGLKRVMIALKLLGYKNVVGVTGVHDSGGDTKTIREEFGIIPVGDLREVLAELSGNPYLNYKIGNWHKAGNYFLALLIKKYGAYRGAEIFSELLNVGYKVFPIADKPTHLHAITDKGTIKYEHVIEKCNKKINKIFLKPEVAANKKVIRVIKNSDWVIFAPGSFYTSVLSLLLYKGVKKAIMKAKRRLIIANLTRDMETTHLKNLSEYLNEFERYGVKSYIVLANSKRIKNYIIPDVIGENIIPSDLVGKDGHDIKKLMESLSKVLPRRSH